MAFNRHCVITSVPGFPLIIKCSNIIIHLTAGKVVGKDRSWNIGTMLGKRMPCHRWKITCITMIILRILIETKTWRGKNNNNNKHFNFHNIVLCCVVLCVYVYVKSFTWRGALGWRPGGAWCNGRGCQRGSGYRGSRAKGRTKKKHSQFNQELSGLRTNCCLLLLAWAQPI